MMPPPLEDPLAIAGCTIFLAALAALLVPSARKAAMWFAVFLAAPLAAAFAIDAWSGHATRLLIAHGAPLTAMAVSADERQFAFADQNGAILVSQTDSGRIVYATKTGSVKALYFVTHDDSGAALNSPRLLAVDDTGSFVFPLEPSISRQAQQQPPERLRSTSRLIYQTYIGSAINKDGIVAALLAGSSSDPDVENIYEIHFFRQGMPLLLMSARPTSIVPYQGNLAGTIMSDAATQPFLLGFDDGTVGIVWHDNKHGVHIAKANLIARDAAPQPVIKLASSPANDIASIDSEGIVALWHLSAKSGEPVKREKFFTETKEIMLLRHTSRVATIAISPDGTFIVSGGDDGVVRLWTSDGKPAGVPLTGHAGGVGSVAFSPDGTRIVSGAEDGTVRLWTLDGKLVAEPFKGHVGAVFSVAFSPDGTRIISGGEDGSVRLWTFDGKPAAEPFKGHVGAVFSVAFSPDSTHIVSGGKDGTVRLWTLDGKLAAEPFKGHVGAVFSVAFSPDGTRIATGGEDKTVRLWAPDGKLAAEPFIGHEDGVTSVTFSPDGSRIGSGSLDKTVRLWMLDGKPAARRFYGHEDRVSQIAWSPNGLWLATASADHTVRVWEASYSDCKGCASLAINQTSNVIELVDNLGGQTRIDLASGQRISASPPALPASALFVDDHNYTRLFSMDDGSVEATSVMFGGTDHLSPHTSQVSQALFLTDGRIITGALDGSVRILDLRLHTWLSYFDVWPKLVSVSDAIGNFSETTLHFSAAKWMDLTFICRSMGSCDEPLAPPGTTFRDCAEECPEMVVVPSGSFDMGSDIMEAPIWGVSAESIKRASPQHRVTITQPFALGRYEVTRADYAAFVKATGYVGGGSCHNRNPNRNPEWTNEIGKDWRDPGFMQTDQEPVVCVNWGDAQAYIKWLRKKTGKKYRLPTEAEWEYAARANTSTVYPWGNDIGKNKANCNGCGSEWDNKKTAPASSFAPNGFNLYDMAGNVWEWLADCYHLDYVGAPADGSEWQANNCHLRSARGGTWYYGPDFLRSANRGASDPDVRDFGVGFRVARD